MSCARDNTAVVSDWMLQKSLSLWLKVKEKLNHDIKVQFSKAYCNSESSKSLQFSFFSVTWMQQNNWTGVGQVWLSVSAWCRRLFTSPGCDGVPGESSQQWWELMCAVTVGVWGGLDGFGGILLADENFQEAELGLDPLVLPVLLQHRHPVLLLNIPAAEDGDGGEKLLISVLKKSLLCLLADTCSLFLHQLRLRSCQTEPLTTVQQSLKLYNKAAAGAVFSVYWGETTREKPAHTFVMTVYRLYYMTGCFQGNSRKLRHQSPLICQRFTQLQHGISTELCFVLSELFLPAWIRICVSCSYQLTYQTKTTLLRKLNWIH